jgi:hypothetical protein
MQSVYLIRYGLMRHVSALATEAGPLERGQMVVIHSPRGTELGEVLAPAPLSLAPLADASVVRPAGTNDLARAQGAEADRPRRLAACEGLFGQGVWPLTILDVEPLLDDHRTVVYYLGPHRLESAGLRQVVRETLGLDIVLEPVGRDEPEATGCGTTCGAQGCGGGGCGTDGDAHGCDGCAVKDLVRARRSKRPA